MKNLSEVILPSFHDFWKAVRDCKHPETGEMLTHYVCKGGRNSSKSTTISLSCILLLTLYKINGLVVRKIANTLQESVYEQLKEAAFLLGIEDEFQFNVNPLRIIYKKTGNRIIFRGADDPLKIKSIKTAEFPIAFIWFEEVDEFKTEDALQTIIDSILRAGLPDNMQYRFFYSYNPPKRKQHWLNKKYETQFLPKGTFVHHSDYRSNPYLPKQTLDEIERLKETSKSKYEWRYLGKCTGGGIVPFDNLVFRKITDEEIKSFDNIRQGIDWGYASDPFCFLRHHFDKTRRKLYFMDEIYGVKLSNREVANEIIKRGYQNIKTIADSAEPKSIAELREYGIRIDGATKGPGSVEFGEKWLDDLEEIIIDPERTPNAAREFENIDYQIDKDGNQKPKLEDKENHSVDGTRYSLQNDMQRNGVWLF